MQPGCWCVLALAALGGSAAWSDAVVNDTGVTVAADGRVTRVELLHGGVARVVHAEGREVPNIDSLVVNDSSALSARQAGASWRYTKSAREGVLSSQELTVQVDLSNGAVRFLNKHGVVLLSEALKEDGAPVERSPRIEESTPRVYQSFHISPGEAIYGLGQHQRGVMNWVGNKAHLQQRNSEVAVPVLLSSRGYAMLWDNPSVTEVDISHDESGRLAWSSEAGKAVVYYFFAGPEPDAAIASYRRLTGAAPMFPKWVWGFWQCKERYATQQELLQVLETYRELGVPLDGVIQDWQYWKPGHWGSHEFDPERYPDPAGMVEAIHRANAHAIVSVWPRFDEGTDNHVALESAGALYAPLYPNVYPQGYGKWYDPFNPVGRRLYWRQVHERLARLGFDGWWLDACEAELGGKWGQMRDVNTAAGPGAEVLNAYPLMHTTAVYEGHRADIPEKRVFILSRSAFAGQQRNASVTWSGDIHGKWDVFARQIPAGLNFVATGIPYWNTDIGGFFGGDPADPGYRELFTRWFQFGAFCPMFRVHGTGAGKEVWRFNKPTQEILTDYIRLRYHLLPYIYSVSWMVTNDGYTMMRPLVMDFHHDPGVFDVADQFMFGPSLLVNPVTREGADSRSVYLPEPNRRTTSSDALWYDFWTGERLPAGHSVQTPSPIGVMPLFVRAGSILPYGPEVEYSTQKSGPIELRVYRGADAQFILYDDEGDGYGYEEGRYATIPLRWDEDAQMLTIGARKGGFPGMPKELTFRVVWVEAGHGAGIEPTETADAELQYRGEEILLSAQ